MKPAIVVVTYNRPNSLKSLLNSIHRAIYNVDNIPLIISIDGGAQNNSEMVEIAETFKWKHGRKRIIKHEGNNGLREHVIFCGNLSKDYNAIIMLEDDLIVSPGYYQYAIDSLNFYKEDNMVAGISLYSYEYSEISRERFYPLNDGHGAYFMQWPSSWGQIWTKKQWNGFHTWYLANKDISFNNLNIPNSVKLWPQNSWKKYFIVYLILYNKYFVYPRGSLSTPTGDSGTHTKAGTTPITQVALLMGVPYSWDFIGSNKSVAYYDCFFQPEPRLLNNLCPWLKDYDYVVDLQANKPLSSLNETFLLSVRTCKNPVRTFGWKLFPLELNIVYEIQGNEINFGPTSMFSSKIPFTKYGALLTWTKRLLSPADYIKIIISKTMNLFIK